MGANDRKKALDKWIEGSALAGLAVMLSVGSLFAAPNQYDVIAIGGPGTAIEAIDSGHAAGFLVRKYLSGHAKHYCRRALVWPMNGTKPAELNAPGTICSEVSGMSGVVMAGTASPQINGLRTYRSVVWNIETGRAHFLSNPGIENSWANGITADQVVGQSTGRATHGYLHASMWNLANGVFTDLNGKRHKESGALATNGVQQIGWAADPYGENPHAMLWSGRSHTQTDLHPPPFLRSYGLALDGSSQVGLGETSHSAHALLWRGSASSAIDLNPAGYLESFATGVRRNIQIGYALTAEHRFHALAWSGAASKYIDLQASLPSTLTESFATCIDSTGEIGGYATDANGAPHAVIWRPAQAPTPKA